MYKLIRTLARTSAGLAIFSLFLLLIALAAWYELNRVLPLIKYRCSDFSSYQAAQKAYLRGAAYLDGNANGRACELLRTN